MKKKIFLMLCFLSMYANADNENVADTISILENYKIIKRPIEYIDIENKNLDINILSSINERSSKYIASNEYQILKDKIDNKITEDEADCITSGNNTALCLGNKTSVTYNEYKIGNFIQGILDESIIDNKEIDNDKILKVLENDNATNNNDLKENNTIQPVLLSLIDKKQEIYKEEFKQITSECMSSSNEKDNFISCLTNTSYEYKNPFLNVTTFCFSSGLLQNIPQKQFSIFIATCYNKNIQSIDFLNWISQESYRMGSVFYELNKDKFQK